MKKSKKTTYKIFSFTDLSIETLYQNHLELIQIGTNSNNNPEWLNFMIENTLENNKNLMKKPRKFEMLEKYQFMVHLLITKTFYKGYVDLPAVYMKYIFGDYYSIMLFNLCRLGYFIRVGYYKPKAQVRRIYIVEKNVICRQYFDAGHEKYRKKYLKKKKQRQNDRLKRMTKNFGNEFINQYLCNLNRLELVNKTGARDFILNNFKDIYNKEKNLYILEQYKIGTIPLYNIDMDKRIYSLLTNTNRNLRSYLNINYILDISNCHPLLFNKYIIDKYNISDNLLFKLYTINTNILLNKKNTYSIQYVSNVFYNLLNDTNIENSDFINFPLDVLLYICLTSQGKFWEYIMKNDLFVGVDRSDVKEKMFKEVFYSKVIGGKNMVYQEEFKKAFPNVFKIILDHRRLVKNGQEKHLSHYLMRTESDIIHSVLRDLFKQGIVAVNIHDAIVVLDVEENIHLEINEIVEIFQLKIKNHGLYGNVKIEYFNSLE